MERRNAGRLPKILPTRRGAGPSMKGNLGSMQPYGSSTAATGLVLACFSIACRFHPIPPCWPDAGSRRRVPAGERNLVIGSPSLAESRMPQRKSSGTHACGARSHWHVCAASFPRSYTVMLLKRRGRCVRSAACPSTGVPGAGGMGVGVWWNPCLGAARLCSHDRRDSSSTCLCFDR